MDRRFLQLGDEPDRVTDQDPLGLRRAGAGSHLVAALGIPVSYTHLRGAKLLLDAGYRDVYNLIGGLATWNGELEKDG